MIDLVGTTEAARILGIAKSTVTFRVRSGTLPTAGKMAPNTGAYLFDRKVLEELVKGERK